jgi:hypothetical protein
MTMGNTVSYQLVLTACVHPNGMYVKVTDADVRQRQYLDALGALLAIDSPVVGGITFIENRGADLTPFRQWVDTHNRHGKKVELIGLNMNDFPRELGVGYGEFRALDKGISDSQLIGPDAYLVKLTGRLIVRNLAALLGALPMKFDMAADVEPFKDPGTGWIDSRLMIFSRDFYFQKVMGLYEQVNGFKGVAIEHVLYQMIRRSPGARIIARLPREPQWVGYSGSTGMRYDSLRMRLKYPPKVVARALRRMMNLPNLNQVWAKGA